jgi:hypothetical protein
MIDETYPGVLTGFDENTKVIFKIGQDDFDNIAKRYGISRTSFINNIDNRIAYFWPVHDKSHNSYTFEVEVEKNKDALAKNPYEILFYTNYMLNHCVTSDFSPLGPSSIRIPGGEIPKKTIQ